MTKSKTKSKSQNPKPISHASVVTVVIRHSSLSHG
jgi:hypothetical protein